MTHWQARVKVRSIKKHVNYLLFCSFGRGRSTLLLHEIRFFLSPLSFSFRWKWWALSGAGSRHGVSGTPLWVAMAVVRRCETEKLFPARKNHRTHRSQAIQRGEFAAHHTNRSKWNFPSWYGRVREGKFFTLNNFLRHKTTLTFDILLCVTAEKWRMANGFAPGNDFSSKLWVDCRCQPYLLLVL